MHLHNFLKGLHHQFFKMLFQFDSLIFHPFYPNKSVLSYFFLTFFCTSLTTKSAVSEFNVRFTVLFFLFDAPNLKMFGKLSIPWFISF